MDPLGTRYELQTVDHLAVDDLEGSTRGNWDLVVQLGRREEQLEVEIVSIEWDRKEKGFQAGARG